MPHRTKPSRALRLRLGVGSLTAALAAHVQGRAATGGDPGAVPAYSDGPEMTPKRTDVKGGDRLDLKEAAKKLDVFLSIRGAKQSD